MKKSINIGVIVFLLLHACSSSENTENQTIVEPISEDTPINEPAEPNNPPPPEGNNPPPPPEGNNPPSPEGNNPPPPPEGGNDIDRAIQIINDADDEVLDCISRALPTDIYQKIVNDLNPDNFEAGVIIGCFKDPTSSPGIAQPPPSSEGGYGGDSTTPTTVPSDTGSGGTSQPGSPEGNRGDSWYDLNVYEYSPSYSVATLSLIHI